MKKIICMLTAAALSCTAVYAKIDNKTILSGETFLYSGKTSADARMSITVLKPSVTLEEFNESADKSSLLVGYRETVTDSAGNFSFNLNFNGESGVYEVYTGIEGSEDIVHSKLHYVNSDANTVATENLTSAITEDSVTQKTSVKNVILNGYKELGMDVSLMQKATDSEIEKAVEILISSVTASNFVSPEKTAGYLDKALAIAMYNSGKINIFGEYEDLFITDAEFKAWCEKDFVTESLETFIEKRVKNNTTSFETFDASLTEAVALGIIYGADGYGTVTKYLKKYALVLNIDESSVTDSYSQSIIGNQYNSIPPVDTQTKPNKPAGGGGGGGAGGSSGGKNVASGLTIGTTEQNAEPIEKTEEKNQGFQDLTGFEWAMDSINALEKSGVISGRAAGVFAPSEVVLREEFVKMILGVLPFEELYGEIKFDDVKEEDWFYPYVKNAFVSGIIKGVSESSFGSGASISRQDMAVICYNTLNQKGLLKNITGLKELNFEDSESISEYAQLAVRYLNENGILTGDENNMFMPLNNLSRAEAAVVIYRIQKLAENGGK